MAVANFPGEVLRCVDMAEDVIDLRWCEDMSVACWPYIVGEGDNGGDVAIVGFLYGNCWFRGGIRYRLLPH